MSSSGSSGTEVLYIALGNPLRRDDGVAWKVIETIAPDSTGPDHGIAASCRSKGRGSSGKGIAQLQATPELAAEIAGFHRVVFIDAEVQGQLRLERIEERSSSSLTHATGPAEVVALARALYNFAGEAWLCRIPGEDFAPGEGLSHYASANAALAVRLLEEGIKSGA
jgi:hydrogenase maturation protease